MPRDLFYAGVSRCENAATPPEMRYSVCLKTTHLHPQCPKNKYNILVLLKNKDQRVLAISKRDELYAEHGSSS